MVHNTPLTHVDIPDHRSSVGLCFEVGFSEYKSHWTLPVVILRFHIGNDRLLISYREKVWIHYIGYIFPQSICGFVFLHESGAWLIPYDRMT